jgi:hypothetical protein
LEADNTLQIDRETDKHRAGERDINGLRLICARTSTTKLKINPTALEI